MAKEETRTTQDLAAALALGSLHQQEPEEVSQLSDRARIGEAPYSHQSMRWGWHPNTQKGNKTG